MNIKEVLKEENVGMEYKIRERIYKVEKSFTGLLALKNVESYGYIESEMHIFDIVNGEFEEVMDWSKVPVDTKVLVSDDVRNGSEGILLNMKMARFIVLMTVTLHLQ